MLVSTNDDANNNSCNRTISTILIVCIPVGCNTSYMNVIKTDCLNTKSNQSTQRVIEIDKECLGTPSSGAHDWCY